MQKQQRVWYLDILRIFATVGVVAIHVAGQNWNELAPQTFGWQIFNLMESLSVWSVSAFVMISGALFLGREHSIRTLYKKNILRLATAFAFWSVLYAVLRLKNGSGIMQFANDVFIGHYHMWFLLMIAGMYMLVPLLNKLVENEKLLLYFLGLSVVFTFILPQITALAEIFFTPLHTILSADTESSHFFFTLGYTPYFIAGYYLSRKDLSAKVRRWIYLLGVVGFVGTIACTAAVSLIKNQAVSLFYDRLTLNVVLFSVAVFVFFRNVVGRYQPGERMQKVITALSKYSFGVYLVHPLVMEQLDKLFGLNTLSFNPIVSCVVLLVSVSGISLAISAVLNHIPVLKKYIV